MELLTKLLVEFIGTFVLLCVIMTTLKDGKLAAIEVSLTLAGVIFFASKISGGHFNPAVSIMMLLKNDPKYGGIECVSYVITQILSGICAYYFITSSLTLKYRKRK